MKSFRDPVTGALKAYGFTESNAPGDLSQDEDDSFSLAPGEWRWVNGVWSPYVAPAAVPSAVSAFQARAALAGAGMLDTVEGMMADAATPLMARLAWQHATEFLRTSPTVAAMGAALNLDDAALDALFVAASTIVA